MLANVSPALVQGVAEGLGMEVPAAMPRAITRVPRPEVKASAALSLLARPGETGIRTRCIALLVADGVDDQSLLSVRDALRAQGAVARLVGPRVGPFRGTSGAVVDADASMENEPAVLFDALVLPDGEECVATLGGDGRTEEYIKEQYRHCKPILALGASSALLDGAGVFATLPDGTEDPGVLIADTRKLKGTIKTFVAAIGRHRVFERERDPPRV